ncbi:hypothetical protein HXZ66_05050 [Bacillus sp. A116_S68]|nr:hypothetical protein HXZ66_05050 [Bacillus sp. A116_S68]
MAVVHSGCRVVRCITSPINRTFLKTQHDSWLFEEDKWPNGVPINHYYLWYHVLEDEISHRGQIRMMIRQLSENKRH